MKKHITNQFSPIGKEQTGELTSLVKETMVLGKRHVKTFTSADLWNIQYKSRTGMTRRNFF